MRTIGTVFNTVVFLFFLTLIGRLVFDWVQVLSRDWRPKGAVLVVAELVYTVTDPPLRLLRKVIPSINLGGMRIDIAFLVLMVITSLLMTDPHRLSDLQPRPSQPSISHARRSARLVAPLRFDNVARERTPTSRPRS